jgi:hypothetical protein
MLLRYVNIALATDVNTKILFFRRGEEREFQ